VDEYGIYVYWAYGITLIVLLGNWGWGLLKMHRVKNQLKSS